MSDTASTQNIGSAFDLPKKSYELVKKNPVPFLVTNIFALLSALAAFFPGKNDASDDESIFSQSGIGGFGGFELGAVLGFGALVIAAVILVNIFLYVMLTALQTRTARGETPGLGLLINDGKKYFLRMIGLTIVSIVIIGVGLLLLIVPGIIAIARLAMAPYAMIDKDLSITEAMAESNRMGKSHFGKVWAALGVLILITFGAGLLGVIPFVGTLIGTLISIAVSLILALRYFQLKAVGSDSKKPILDATAAPPPVAA